MATFGRRISRFGPSSRRRPRRCPRATAGCYRTQIEQEEGVSAGRANVREGFCDRIQAAEDVSEVEKRLPQFERRELFQKQTHTVKIDDAVTDEEQIHPQDPINSRVALLEHEIGQ